MKKLGHLWKVTQPEHTSVHLEEDSSLVAGRSKKSNKANTDSQAHGLLIQIER
jgi:hypothetical protein